MQAKLALSLSVLASAATAWVVSDANASSFHRPAAGSGPVHGESQALVALRSDLGALRTELAELRSRPLAGTSVARVAEAPVSAVARRGSTEGSTELLPETTGAAWPADCEDALGVARSILELGVDGEEASLLWEEAAANDQLHEILAAMEEELGRRPETAENHFLRGRAYYAAAGAKPWNQEGNWWVDSDDAFTRTLELDPYHWDARYTKARNMSFWPAAYGGQAEAARHFEILIGQQEAGSPEAHHVKTYYWLGNIYDQQGKSELAEATWNRGLGLFPDDESLAKKLSSFGR